MGITNKDIIVDHINHKQYDNRKNNLRICTQHENTMNASLSKNNKTGINGVSKMKNGRYRAYINFKFKQIHLGCFDSLDEAKVARNSADIKYYGEYANLDM